MTDKNQVLVLRKRNKAKTTSLIVSEKFSRRHDNVVRDIRNLVKKGCDENFWFLNFEERDYKDDRGKNYPFFEMTRDGFTMLVMGYTGKKAMQFKIDYINAFSRMEEWILSSNVMQQSSEWLATREECKEYRESETDTIRDFIEYCSAQGSNNAEKYYLAFSKMVNHLMFEIPEGMPKPKNMRNALTKPQLIQVSTADMIVENAVVEGMAKGLYYKEIYQQAKERISDFVRAIGGRVRIMQAQIGLFEVRKPAIAINRLETA
jgi:Rha family phage regulatory protein